MPAFSTAGADQLVEHAERRVFQRVRMTLGSRSLISVGSMSARDGMGRSPFLSAPVLNIRRARVEGTSSMLAIALHAARSVSCCLILQPRPRFSSLRRSALSLMKPAASRWS